MQELKSERGGSALLVQNLVGGSTRAPAGKLKSKEHFDQLRAFFGSNSVII